VGSDSSIAHGGYVGARTGLVEAQNKIIRNKTIKKKFLFLNLKHFFFLIKKIQKNNKNIKKYKNIFGVK